MDTDEIVSKSRHRRLVKLAKAQGTPHLMDTLLEHRDLVTEHVADVLEGAEMRIAARKMLASTTNLAMSPAAATAVFGPEVKVTQTATIDRNEIIVDAEVIDD